MKSPLEFHAGARVRAHIAREGFRLEDFPTVLGAAGGPKWLVLYGLDRVLAPQLRTAARRSGRGVDLIGASIGAWRFAAWAQDHAAPALDRLYDTYVDAEPFEKPPPSFAALFRGYLVDLLGNTGAEEILAARDVRLHAVLTRCAPSVLPHLVQLSFAATRNAVSRAWFLRGTERLVAGTQPLPETLVAAWPHRHVPLNANNLVDCLMATAAVPGMIPPITGLDPEAPRARAIDGGIVDYHFDGSQTAAGFVLYPHFRSTLTPGWFDKPFRSRQRPASAIDDLLLICPTPEFIATLPNGRVPDRGDPRRLGNAACVAAWREAGAASRALGETLGELLERDAIPALLGRAA